MDQAQTQQDSDEIRPWSTVEQLVRTLRVPAADAPSLVSQIVGEAVRVVPAAREAGLILTDPDHNLNTVFASGPAPRELDDLQIRLGTGRASPRPASRSSCACTTSPPTPDGPSSAAPRSSVPWAACSACRCSSTTRCSARSVYGAQPDVFRNQAEPAARVLATLAAVASPTPSTGSGSSGRWATET